MPVPSFPSDFTVPPPRRPRDTPLRRRARVRARRVELALARRVAARTDAQLEAPPVGPVFRAILPWVLRRKFRPDKASALTGGPLTTRLAVTVSSSTGGRDLPLDIAIAERRCSLRVRRCERADATMTIALADMMRLAAGAAEANVLVSRGRIRLSGDAFVPARFGSLFGMRSRPVLPPEPRRQEAR